MARISNSDTAKAVMEILVSETEEDGRYKLVSQMASNNDRFEANMLLLEKLKQGFVEGLDH